MKLNKLGSLTAEQKVAYLILEIKRGKTLYVSALYHTTKITPKIWARWEESGFILLKAVKNSIYLARGKNFDCIDYCTFVLSGQRKIHTYDEFAQV